MLRIGTNTFHNNTLPGFLYERATNFPSHRCYSFPDIDQSCTWSSLWEEVKAVAMSFNRLGVRKGDRIAILLEGRVELLVSIFAAVTAGAVAMPLNTYLKKEELRQCFLEAQPAVFIIGSAAQHLHHSDLCNFKAGSPFKPLSEEAWIPYNSFVQGCESNLESPFRFYSELKNGSFGSSQMQTDMESMPFTSNDPAFLLFTSGSTGRPKGVIRSLASFMVKKQAERAESKNRVKSFFSKVSDTYVNRLATLNLLPAYHLAGLGMVLMPLYVCNVRMNMLTRFNPVLSLNAIEQTKAKFLTGTPHMIQAIMDAKQASATKTDSVLGIIFTSSALEHKVIKRTAESFKNLYFFMVSYGSSETGAVANGICFLNNKSNLAVALLLSLMRRLNYLDGEIPVREFFKTTASIGGKIGKNIEVGIRDLQTGEWLPKGENGEIMIRGHRVMPYVNAIEDQEDFIQNGWFKSGDIGYVNDRNFIMITGRIKEVISRGGEKIAPAEIEQVIRQYPGIEDVLVLGVPDPLYGERICAAFVEQTGCRVSLPDLINMLKSSLSKFKVPDHFLSLSAFPLNASGKVAVDEIRKQFLSVNTFPLHA